MKQNLTLIVVASLLLFGVCIFFFYSNGKKGKVTVIHTVSYSNAVVFNAIEHNPDRIVRNFTPNPTQHVEALIGESRRGPVVSVTPFSNAIIAANSNPSLRIIGGAGLNGISLVAREATTPEELRGKKIGTARGDSLEIFAVEYMQANGVDVNEYEFRYFTDPFEMVEALKRGSIDAAAHVEPFVTNLVEENNMVRLITSRELWGDHPDAVLLTTEHVLKEYFEEMKWLLTELKNSEKAILSAPEATASRLAETFYQMPPENLLRILEHQGPKIDIRQYDHFFADRFETMRALTYVSGTFRKEYFDYTLLDLLYD